MHRLNELAGKLTPAQVREVEDFAEFLAFRAARETPVSGFLDVAALAGLCAGMGGDKSSVELVDEAIESWAVKLDGEG